MGDSVKLVSTFGQAEIEETQFDWLKAKSHYQQILERGSNNPLILGETCQRLAFALYMEAMQSDSEAQFRSHTNESIEYYRRAKDILSKQERPERTPGAESCDAMILFLDSTIIRQSSEKKRLLGESWGHAKEALGMLEESGDALRYARTFCQLSRSVFVLQALEWDPKALELVLEEAWDRAERALKLLSSQENVQLSARVRVLIASILNLYVDNVPNPDDQERYSHKAKEHWRLARELSEEAALLQLSDNPLGGFLFGAESSEAVNVFHEALKRSRKTRDRLTIGSAFDQLAYHTWLTAYATEDPDNRTVLLNNALAHAREANEQYRPLMFSSPRGSRFWVHAPEADYYLELSQFETDLEKKRHLLESTVKAASERLEQAEEAGYPLVIRTAHHVLSLALSQLARCETKAEERRTLLEKALTHRDDYVKITERISPFFYWNRGIGVNYTSEIKTELAILSDDEEKKRTLIQEAIRAKEECLKLCQHDLPFIERTGSASMILALGQRRLEYGDLLARLYSLTKETAQIRSAVDSFVEAAGLFERMGHKAHMAECYWRAAQGLDQMSDYSQAAQNFVLAATCYDNAAESSPQLKAIYANNSSYMKAWAAVEEAKLHHEKEQYASAKEQYETAAQLFRSTDRLAMFADNFSAWAQIENGEALSGSEKAEEAVSAFQNAAALFKNSKRSIQASLAKIESPDEREVASRLVKAADLRSAYCQVRIRIEEAKSLAKKADYFSSSDKYGDAAAALEKIIQSTDEEQARRELQQMLLLSRAWQKMSRAEGEDSPELYREASRLFDQARALSLNEKQSSLALGHSRFCRALEEGTRFMDTRDPEVYKISVQDLDNAASLYLKAGFIKESEYAKASKLLFDAYVYMEDATHERNAKKKTRLYAMAETVLRSAQSSFERSGHQDKREQVRRLLDKITQEKQLAASLSELLSPTRTIFASASPFPTPEPTQEKPVGLERLRYADIQARMISSETSLEVGENLEIGIELVNAGRGPAQLVKVEDVVPEGFEIAEKPESFAVEDTYLSLKGKRLNPLKTQKLNLVLRPKVQGTFTLRPRILYLDEGGSYKLHETDPIEVTVRELGTTGLAESERKLAAIMFTDMVGYTAISQKNENLAMELLAEHRKIVRPLYPRHGGREVKTMGDAFLVEFSSALEAVKCAFEVQKCLHDRNAVAPVDRPILVRIGIHMGDVIHSGRDVYGDAVNVASRIEPLAEPGGICVSDHVYDSVKNALGYRFENIGLREMKNVADSIMVYRVLMPWGEPQPPILVNDKADRGE